LLDLYCNKRAGLILESNLEWSENNDYGESKFDENITPSMKILKVFFLITNLKMLVRSQIGAQSVNQIITLILEADYENGRKKTNFGKNKNFQMVDYINLFWI